MPRVTVICATYNRSNVLPYAIHSVIGQTYADWELLVVGDECTDDSAAVVEHIARVEDRVRWINLVPGTRNQYGPNNEGLRQARGELIAYIGHDDLWLPHHLQVLVSAIDEGADVAHSMIRLVAEPGTCMEDDFMDECDSPISIMHRRELSERLGGWRDYRALKEYPQTEIWRRFRNYGARFQFVPRLSVIKPSAGFRDNVYKLRSTHEQEHWAARICNEPDLEITELILLLQQARTRQRASRLFGLGQRLRFHWNRIKRGKLPHFSTLNSHKAGGKMRVCNRVRGVHQDETR